MRASPRLSERAWVTARPSVLAFCESLHAYSLSSTRRFDEVIPVGRFEQLSNLLLIEPDPEPAEASHHLRLRRCTSPPKMSNQGTVEHATRRPRRSV
jgi:hypothetical protein